VATPVPARTARAQAQEIAADRPSFDEWVASIRTVALARGIRPETLDVAFADLAPLPVVVERDRTQAEVRFDLDRYLKRRLTRRMLRTAGEQLRQHHALLDGVYAAHGVEPQVIVSIWGLESNFGRFAGVRPTIAALATLGWEGRREEFFREELIAALRILQSGDVSPSAMKGSWAGAMGQPQFMPSSYLQYAQDFDGDGRRDIWTSLPDVFASIAKYLAVQGWVKGERWGREVKVSKPAAGRIGQGVPTRDSSCAAARQARGPLPLRRWQELGVRLPGGGALPRSDMEASLFQAGKRSFLLYRNYDAILSYNCANTYALSVGLLADRAAGAGRR
jgi:membrane-bound lytic murein transglycosylase B